MTEHAHDQLHVFVPLDPWWEEQIVAQGCEIVSPVYKCPMCLAHLASARFAVVGRKSAIISNLRRPQHDPELVLADFKVKWQLPEEVIFDVGPAQHPQGHVNHGDDG